MRNLARVLHSEGWTITGSDGSLATAVLREFRGLGIHPVSGHAAGHVPFSSELLIYSPAVPATNPERVEAARRGIPQLSYVEVLARLMAGRIGVSIAGTHGKSSTTAMLGAILRAAGESPLVLLGADPVTPFVRRAAIEPLPPHPNPLPRSNVEIDGEPHRGGVASKFPPAARLSPHFPISATPYCLVESCEYREHFLALTPQVICLTSIEPDHFDCFPTLDQAVAAYGRFVGQLARREIQHGLHPHLVYCADDPRVCELAQRFPFASCSYGMKATPADWSVSKLDAEGSHFQLRHQGQNVGEVAWSQLGDHQLLNALGAAATASVLGIQSDQIVAGLSRFQGLRRRLEVISADRVSVYDDYAHHPTAIRYVLQTLRQKHGPQTELWCAFQPHQVSRTLGLMAEFATTLALADRVFIVPIFGARETPSTDFVEVAQQLTLGVRQAGGQAEFLPRLDDLTVLLAAVPAGDVFVTLGAGDIDRIHHERPGSVP